MKLVRTINQLMVNTLIIILHMVRFVKGLCVKLW